jgi:hypothetical protein
MLAIVLAGGIEPQTAAWAIDALSLYVAVYALETSLVRQRQQDPGATWVVARDDLMARFTARPETRFPQTRRYAAEPTSGTGHQTPALPLRPRAARRRPHPAEHAAAHGRLRNNAARDSGPPGA